MYCNIILLFKSFCFCDDVIENLLKSAEFTVMLPNIL